MLGDLFYRIGQTIGGLQAQVQPPVGGAAAAGGAAAGGGDGFEGGQEDLVDSPQDVALAAAAAWLLSRLFRPKPVRWPRVVFAGLAATIIADLVGRVEDEELAGGRVAYADNPAELLARLGAGVAVAAGYASILYPRLPGSPLFRGLAFGALEIAAAPRGGLVQLAAQAPGIRFPLQTLALPVDEDASPLAHLVFGATLGILYRDGLRRPVEDIEDEDQDEE